MNKIIFGVFAHPDDETVGTAGVLKQETDDGAEVHVITLTDGEAGNNPDDYENLGEVRREECREACRILGVKSVEFLGYEDGKLNNQDMQDISRYLVKRVTEVAADAPEGTEIEFITLDLNGYTGHVDHIVAARAATLAFFTLKHTDPRFTRIRYSCLPEHLYPQADFSWIYQEPGRKPEEIDEIVDAREFRGDIEEALRAHDSQREDYRAAMKTWDDELGMYYLIDKY